MGSLSLNFWISSLHLKSPVIPTGHILLLNCCFAFSIILSTTWGGLGSCLQPAVLTFFRPDFIRLRFSSMDTTKTVYTWHASRSPIERASSAPSTCVCVTVVLLVKSTTRISYDSANVGENHWTRILCSPRPQTETSLGAVTEKRMDKNLWIFQTTSLTPPIIQNYEGVQGGNKGDKNTVITSLSINYFVTKANSNPTGEIFT